MKNNLKNNNIFLGNILNIVKETVLQNDGTNKYFMTFDVEVDASNRNNFILHNSIKLKDIKPGFVNFYLKKVFKSNDLGAYNYSLPVTFSIESLNVSSYSANKIIIFTIKGEFPQLPYNIINSDYDSITLYKIGAKPEMSGRLGKSIKKRLDEISYSEGVFPSSKITTGKLLQSFKDPFEEFNLIEFGNKNVSHEVGFPLKSLSGSVNNNFYITTDSNILSENAISEDQEFIKNQFRLDKSKIISTPNHIDNTFLIQRNINSNSLDEVIIQNRFKEEYQAYDESQYLHTEDVSQSFYNTTYDAENKTDYNLGKQKQIKIVLDFSGNNNDGNESIDLNLLNTKFVFNKPNASSTKSQFRFDLSDDLDDTTLTNRDNLVNTNFFNFMKDTNYSVSSHFMPTAYWDFNKGEWNYLQGIKESSSLYNGILGISNYVKNPDNAVESDNFPEFGERKEYTDIFNDIMFASDDTLLVNDIIRLNEENRNIIHFSKPLLTTPGMRNDNSILSSSSGLQLNKTPLSQISDSYGFPWKATWQPHNNHQLDMSKYISKDFLLEKVVFKGVYSSRGEMPVRIGNYSSGYLKETGNFPDSTLFRSHYNMKDDNTNCISNNITFFLLNERQNQNYLSNKIEVQPLQHYNFLLTNDSQETINNNNIYSNTGVKLSNFLGNFETYEEYQNKLKVKSYIVPSKSLYNLDEFNNIKSNSSTVFNLYYFKNNDNTNISYNPTKIGSFNKSNFFKLTRADSAAVGQIDKIYENHVNDTWENAGNTNTNLLSGNTYEKYKIFSSYSEDLDLNRSRDLVSYSNLLITSKKTSLQLDDQLLTNIDNHIVQEKDEDNLNINIDKQSFKVESYCKNQNFSNYTDESEYKIKSNYFENVTVSPEIESSFEIRSSYNKNTPELFQLSNASGSDGTAITDIMGIDVSGNNIPHTVPIFSFTLSYAQSTLVETHIKFSYKNPVGLSNRDTFASQDKTLNINQFIEKTTQSYQAAGPFGLMITRHRNIFDINLRLFDTYDNKSSFSDLINKLIFSSNSDETVFNFENSYFQAIKANASGITFETGDGNKWSDFTPEEKNLALHAIIVMVMFYSPYLGLGQQVKDTSGNLIDVQFPSNSFTLQTKSDSPFTSRINFLVSDWSIFNASNPSQDFLITDTSTGGNISYPNNVLISGIANVFALTFILLENNLNSAVIEQESYYNQSYNLEGKYLGESNGLGIVSDRIIDKSPISNQDLPTYKTKSGKLLQSGNSKNPTINSSYLLKPHDKLVVGISSNANGQVMPTVFKLHDKLEITLIGRDYIDDVQYKNNESKSITKTIIGDDFIEKSGASIYQTKGSYFDQVWDLNDVNESLDEFILGKNLIGLNSSKEFGTYSGFITSTQETSSIDKTIYLKDTINPSIGFIYKRCLGKSETNGIDFRDVDDNGISSNKIIFTENFTDAEISDYNLNFSNSLVNNWHNTYHLEEFKNILNNINNIIVNDKSVSYIDSGSESLKTFIYFDVDSYTVDYSEETKIHLQSNNEDSASSNVSRSNANLYKIYERYLSIKDFVLPNSSLDKFQNGLQIQNFESFISQNDSEIGLDFSNQQEFHNFIISNKNISKFNSSRSNFSNLSLQYFDSNLNLDEYCNDIKENSNVFSPQWHLVFELNSLEFTSLTSNLDENSKLNLREGSILDVFIFESSDSTIDQAVCKIAKITRIEDNFYQLAIPLYFWETLEIPQSYFGVDNNIVYGRYESRTNEAQYSTTPAWYAKLNDNTSIIDNPNVYDLFVIDGKTSDYESDPNLDILPVSLSENESRFYINGSLRSYPWKISEIDAIDIGNDGNTNEAIKEKIKLSSKSLFLCLAKFSNNTNSELTPDINFLNPNTKDLNNYYLLNKNSLTFIHKKYLENNKQLIDNRIEQILAPNNTLQKLNEKVYRSKIYKKKFNKFVKTNSYLVYKVHKMYVNTDGITSLVFDENNPHDPANPRNDYNIIEIIAFDSDNISTKKDFVSTKSPCFEIENNDIIRIYEESLKENYKINENINSETPYFEINLSSNTSPLTIGSVSNKQFKQIPYSNLSIKKNLLIEIGDNDNDFSTIQKNFSQIYSNDLIAKSNKKAEDIRRFGTPLFEIKQNPEGYRNINSQEDTMKNFLYGFSKGKFRYPILNLDGFKYGVLSGNKNSRKFHFKTNRFGHFADMDYGSSSYATVETGTGGEVIVNYPIVKQYLGQGYSYVEESNTTQTYNTDIYARSYYPYIENPNDALSQLNQSHPNYNADINF